MAASPKPTTEQLAALEKSVHSLLMKQVAPPSVSYRGDIVKSMLTTGAQLRDNVALKLPLVNVAINAYQELASTREWTVAGKERPVANTVDLINNYRTWDYTNGMVRIGFEAALKQRSIDHLLVGRTAFRINPLEQQIDYLDPTKLYYHTKNLTSVDGIYRPVRPADIVWSYGPKNAAPDIPWGQVHLNHAMPVGINGFIAPFMLCYPQAIMAWLLEQHDETVVDGRKLREIIITGKGLKAPIMQALEQILQLWTGGDPTKQGIPIVELSGQISGPLKDLITTLGLSNIPEGFDRASFMHYYANVISGALGLALRQFWQEDSNTNRALEEVQEARQQLKGPLAFVRSEQRLINNSEIVRMFATKIRPCFFSFVEESDTSSLKDRAEAISRFAASLKDLAEAAGARLKPEIILRQAQEFGILPADMTIQDMLLSNEEVMALMEQQQMQAQVDSGEETVAQSPDQRTNEETEMNVVKAMLIRLEKERIELKKAIELGEDEIRMDRNGKILERRLPTYQKGDIFRKMLDNNEISRHDNGNIEEEDADGFDDPVYVEELAAAARSE